MLTSNSHTDLLLQKWKAGVKGRIFGMITKKKKKKRKLVQIPVQVIWSRALLCLFPSVFDMIWKYSYFLIFLFFFFVIAPQQEHKITWPTIILSLRKAIQMLNPGSLWHYVLLVSCSSVLCVGDHWRPSIFLCNVGLYMQTCVFFKRMCVAVLLFCGS